MATFKTTAGKKVDHCHVRANAWPPCATAEWTAAEKLQKRAYLLAHYPEIIDVVLDPTCKFNCFGYAYTNSHAWFNDPSLFINDDFSDVDMEDAQLGDVLVYRDNIRFTHSAFVEELTDGAITKVRSKWGYSAAVTHHPDYVPAVYGKAVRLIRRKALPSRPATTRPKR